MSSKRRLISFFFILLLDTVLSLYTLPLHDRLIFQWDIDLGQRILNAKVTYKPLPSDDGDPKGELWLEKARSS